MLLVTRRWYCATCACYHCGAITQQAVVQPAAAAVSKAVTSHAAHSGCNQDHTHSHGYSHSHDHNSSSSGSSNRHVHGSSAHRTHITAAVTTSGAQLLTDHVQTDQGPTMQEGLK
jgi:hypothetical protein